MDPSRNFSQYSSRRRQYVQQSVGAKIWLFARKHSHLLLTRPALIFFVLIFSFSLIHAGWNKHVAAEALASQQEQQARVTAAEKKSAAFKSHLDELMADNPNLTVGVSIVSPVLGQRDFGQQTSFDAASTAKLLTAITYLKQVELGKTTLNRKINGQSAQILLRSMIIKSDDTAWSSLNGYLGHPLLQKQASELGIKDYNSDNNTLAGRDIALLLNKLSSGSILTASHQQILLNQMQHANFRDFIIPAVAEDNQAYHKVGINEDNVHDAAIIEHNGQKLVLVIFTNGNGQYNWAARAKLFQQITRYAQAAYL